VIAASALFVGGVLCIHPAADALKGLRGGANSGSLAAFRSSLRTVVDQPILGTGVGTYQERREGSTASELPSLDQVDRPQGSLYIALLVDLGAVGIGLFLLLCLQYVMLLRETSKNKTIDSNIRLIVAGTNSGLIAILVAGMVDIPILQEAQAAVTYVVSVLAGCVVAILANGLPAGQLRSVRNPVHIQWLRRAIGASLIVSGMCAGFILFSTLILVRSALPRAKAAVAKINNRSSSSVERIPETVKDAIVAAEDGNFYQHNGIDWQALHRSLRRDLRALRFVQGGSTITMQTVRYLYLSERKELSRKLTELYLADYLERKLTKPQILELYMSSVDFGLHSPGVTRAARTFFDKGPSQLSLAESAFLAVSIPRPAERRSRVMDAQVEDARRTLLVRIGTYYPDRYSESKINDAIRERIVFAWEGGRGDHVKL